MEGCSSLYVCLRVCLPSVRLELRDYLIWRQFEFSDGKASSSSAKDVCGFLKNFLSVELWLCKVSLSSTILKIAPFSLSQQKALT